MKEIWQKIDEKSTQKLNKFDLKKFFEELANKIKAPMFNADFFKETSEISDECFEDVWYEFDRNETGFISWHHSKPFMQRAIELEKELTIERNAIKEARDIRFAEHQRRVEERAARKAELDRLAKEAELME
jgi:hypothetical protein